MRIAVCDDNLDDLKRLRQLLEKYKSESEMELDITYFDSSLRLKQMLQLERYDLYILDIVMPRVSGIDLGKAIRNSDSECYIVYITTEESFAIVSFAVWPTNYIVKPLIEEKLFQTLNLIAAKLHHEATSLLSVKTRDGIVSVPMHKIMVCEYMKPNITYHMQGDGLIHGVASKEPFSKVADELLEEGFFIKPHISFVCNMRCIKKLTTKDFVMKNDLIVPISRRIYTQIKRQYLDYMFHEIK